MNELKRDVICQGEAEQELKRDVICQGEAEQEVMVDVICQGALWPASQRRIVHPIWTASKSFHIEYQAACVLPILVVMPPRPFPILYSRSERNHREKIGVRVLFEQVLNVEPYCCLDSLPSLATETFVCDPSAVVMHHGKGFGSGHYTAYCYNTEGGFWVHCNDSKLNVCSVEEVCKTQAYILFYTQRTLQDKAGIPEKQLQAQGKLQEWDQGLLWSHTFPNVTPCTPGKAEMPGIHPDVWGTTWLCEKAGEGSRLPPEVRLVVYKLASKAKPALEKRSAPFGAAQKHLPFGRLSEASTRKEISFQEPWLLTVRLSSSAVLGHAVYHLIPGIIRHLWDPNSGLEEESFHAMMSWQKEQMRAAIVHACCQQAVEKLQETAEQQAVSLISSEFPESCSRLPFTMLEKSPLPDVRSNLIAAAGDLAIRLWDLLEPWTSPLCARKGNVKTLLQGDRALGCQDSVPGHAVYHLIPGIVRHLWDPNGGLEEESFHAMMRHLLSFLPKGK
ncbi:hypothetical protein DUI87_28806 [Hirundo rustica rustica]|uniref:ubiquitinyl hydrolase 1 n=1 Tax=Hirundo rustica rustica TaxID=333673 RepID=A0A3M0J1A0_HIRRU|nr:hypothetical protein DUI87_28806 [Hirundo rustica rustica]